MRRIFLHGRWYGRLKCSEDRGSSTKSIHIICRKRFSVESTFMELGMFVTWQGEMQHGRQKCQIQVAVGAGSTGLRGRLRHSTGQKPSDFSGQKKKT